MTYEEFWPLFKLKFEQLSAVYSPVTLHRLYPFLSAHVRDIQGYLKWAAAKNLITVDNWKPGRDIAKVVRLVE